MKVFSIIFSLLFVLSVLLQYNDPDPYLWMPIYFIGAFICIMSLKNKYFPKACIIAILIFSMYAIYLFNKMDGVMDWLTKHNTENIAANMKAETPWIENAREFFGLLILIFVLAINYFYAQKKASTLKQ